MVASELGVYLRNVSSVSPGSAFGAMYSRSRAVSSVDGTGDHRHPWPKATNSGFEALKLLAESASFLVGISMSHNPCVVLSRLP